jgi:hypothetical protein
MVRSTWHLGSTGITGCAPSARPVLGRAHPVTPVPVPLRNGAAAFPASLLPKLRMVRLRSAPDVGAAQSPVLVDARTPGAEARRGSTRALPLRLFPGANAWRGARRGSGFAGALWGRFPTCGGLAARLCGIGGRSREAGWGVPPGPGRRLKTCPTKARAALRTGTLGFERFCGQIASTRTSASRTRVARQGGAAAWPPGAEPATVISS